LKKGWPLEKKFPSFVCDPENLFQLQDSACVGIQRFSRILDNLLGKDK
jgi:hypothetical protein